MKKTLALMIAVLFTVVSLAVDAGADSKKKKKKKKEQLKKRVTLVHASQTAGQGVKSKTGKPGKPGKSGKAAVKDEEPQVVTASPTQSADDSPQVITATPDEPRPSKGLTPSKSKSPSVIPKRTKVQR